MSATPRAGICFGDDVGLTEALQQALDNCDQMLGAAPGRRYRVNVGVIHDHSIARAELPDQGECVFVDGCLLDGRS